MIANRFMNPSLAAKAKRLALPFRFTGSASEDANAARQVDWRDASPVLAQTSKFQVKILETKREYVKAQRLRYDVFHREFRKKKFPFGFDHDRYDSKAEHLIVTERATGRIVGSYRAICSGRLEDLYTSTEFDLSDFMRSGGEKLELSRACIHKDFRTGVVLTLLWRGIAEYMTRSHASYMFGIPSAKTTCVKTAARIYAYFERSGSVGGDARIAPLDTHAMPGFSDALESVRAQLRVLDNLPEDESQTALKAFNLAVQDVIPPLFHVYIKAGAKICGFPALDREFQCVDFFMSLRLDEMSELFKRKYCLNS